MNARIMSDGKLRIENVTGSDIKFRHFSGEKDRYHAQGERDFNLAISDEFAEELAVAGWRVRFGKDKGDGSGEKYSSMIKVKVNYASYKPPIITRFTSLGHVEIDEELVKDIDHDQIESAALIITPYLSKNSEDGKYTPYLENMRYKIEEDPFAGMYE